MPVFRALADPARDAVFSSWLTGWTDTTAEQLTGATRSLRHPSLRGPVLLLRVQIRLDERSVGGAVLVEIAMEAGRDYASQAGRKA